MPRKRKDGADATQRRSDLSSGVPASLGSSSAAASGVQITVVRKHPCTYCFGKIAAAKITHVQMSRSGPLLKDSAHARVDAEFSTCPLAAPF